MPPQQQLNPLEKSVVKKLSERNVLVETSFQDGFTSCRTRIHRSLLKMSIATIFSMGKISAIKSAYKFTFG
jgi:hypothetical protein